ncbi:mechanosensitive ion channel protein [Rhodoferax lacus]|uniref:Mechanosensitive ion channel protein n=1 Tax=Rhodoferax lacus TaxID=2184758 RepID=A0A3E1R7T3_9BURK|nr:mechanosensitive ion channel domain-containing protein [Rhodoferax lacus]RFO95102.1 mechanosensitive ion channel protein [Rhodoferax lacus]
MQKPSAPEPIDDFQGWLNALSQPTVLMELAALGLCVLLAWALVRGLRRALGMQDERSIFFGRRNVDGALFPLVLLCLAYVARDVLSKFVSVALFKVAIPVLVSLLVIRVGVKVLQVAFTQSKWVKPLEQTISWLAWLLMVLWVSGLLPVVLNELDQISWKVGNSTLSVRNVLEGALTAVAVLIVTLWISAGIETRVLRNATGGELSVRKAISNAARALLMFVGLIVALTSVGIDLTALSVLGGAVGVGIGLGLQKLAANYVSGFVILGERSMRIGDNVRVDNFEGVITQINARYTVIRSLAGRESIVPNEMMITSRVENLSLADSFVYQSTVVSVGYDSNVELVCALLLKAASDQPRVLQEPGPVAQLSNFGVDGLEFTLGFWIADPGVGQGGLKSDINIAILAALRANAIDIPYPQRVVHQI